MRYYPEGVNDSLCRRFDSLEEMKAAINNKTVLEGTVIRCDSGHNLWVDLGCTAGFLPKSEGALGIIEGTVRDIALISKVGKRVCFRVMGFHRNQDGELIPVLSRRVVQLDCQQHVIDRLLPGDIIPAKVTRTEPFGAFIDIGCGINSLIPIDMLSVSRINHPRERLRTGQLIQTVLLHREDGKLTFSLKELLGTWMENAAPFHAGETVTGVVRSIESYGVFVELAPNLAGLAEPLNGVAAGQRVAVFIKSVLPAKMKVKLAIVEVLPEQEPAPAPLTYYVNRSHLDSWVYSPPESSRNISTLFSASALL